MNFRGITGAAFAVVLWLASAEASAAGPRAVRKQVESSMLVTGKIQVAANGTVAAFSLDGQDKLPEAVVELTGKAVPKWTFEPVLIDGQAANVSTDMTIRIVAKKAGSDSYLVEIRSASFGKKSGKPKESTPLPDMAPPNYPTAAARAGVGGTVYLLVRVGRDGRVADVIAEQVNLKVVADENSMAKWRHMFADASLRQARRWTFTPPTGLDAKADFWLMRVPVMFSLGDPSKAMTPYGQWESYVPGPRHPNPWEPRSESSAFSPDTLLPGRAYFVGPGLELLTDLSGS